MKKVLFLILIYILTTLSLAALLACFFVLYPNSLPETVYTATPLHTVDIFLYSCLSLLPFVSVVSLTLLLVHLIKTGSRTMLEFLGYTFLCLVTWLIIIPSCIFYQPEQKVSLLITGQSHSSVAAFFQSRATMELAENLEEYYLSPPEISLEIFSDLLFLRNVGRSAGGEGRVPYLLFASMGLALAALYALCSISEWKLINVAMNLLLWYGIIWLNIELYKKTWNFAFDTKWLALIVNGSIFFVIVLIGTVHAVVRRNARKEVE